MKYFLFKTIVCATCVSFWIIVIISHNNAFNYPRASVLLANFVKTHPQGWGFFTKDPRNEYNYEMYAIAENETLNLITHPNFSKHTFFGLSKNNRQCFYEVGLLVNKIKSQNWLKSKGNSLLIPEKHQIIELDMSDSNLTCTSFFDDYLIIRYKTTPFIWSGNGQSENRPFQYIRISPTKK